VAGAVFVARFTAFLRAVMPGLAGMSRMPYGRFLMFNAAGGVIWGVGLTLLGFFAGTSYQSLVHVLGQVSAALAVVLLAGAAFAYWKHRRRNRARSSVRRSMRF